jgi:hypothetical protein
MFLMDDAGDGSFKPLLCGVLEGVGILLGLSPLYGERDLNGELTEIRGIDESWDSNDLS